MSLRSISKKASVATLLTGALLAASVATAAWLANGTGTGTAKAITATALTVDPDTVGSAAAPDLYPGQTDADLFVTVNNPNPYPITVTQISRTPATSITSDSAACNTGGHGVTMDSPVVVSISVLASSSTTQSVPNIVNMATTSDNACQGAVFTIPVTVTGTST